jgi:hypothetical protein
MKLADLDRGPMVIDPALDGDFLTLQHMCTYIQALSAPTMSTKQGEQIIRLRNIAAWHWYRYLPTKTHTLLAHAMTHMADQAIYWGPQTVFWLFHMERSVRSRCLYPAHSMPVLCTFA